MRRAVGVFVLGLALATPAAGQGSGRCLLQVLNVDRNLVGQEPTPGSQNWFAGGNVRMRCVGQDVFMWSDSVASYQGQVIQFIGKVRYRDSTVEMNADFGTYFRDGDRWEARGNVKLTNRRNGATLQGPMLDYLRQAVGVRDTSEVYAELRPTIRVPATDSLNRPGDPYVIVGDRVRIRGNDRVWVGGRVTVDRVDLTARGDSLRLDTGTGSDGTLLGGASIRRTAVDSFTLVGNRIDMELERRELTFVLAQGVARLQGSELDLEADTIGIDVERRRVRQALAWGDSIRPVARSAEGYEVRGDSVAFDTPDQRLTEARAFGDGWMGALPDSVTGERDWIAGDSVTVRFRPGEDSTGAARTSLERLEARGQARAYYRMAPAAGTRGPGSLAYTTAGLIQITMKTAGETTTVDRVISIGSVEGIHLQPSTSADSARAALRRRPGGVRE